ncbi:MAG: DUF6353 family protein [Eubacterium sp.]|nr:DUF6353 family protein [Eubacterium sp.]
MNKPNLSKIAKGIQESLKKHSPEILTGIGIAGMITTAIMAVKATPKALRILQDKWDNELGEEIISSEGREQFTPIEVAKYAWTCYVPAAILGGMSIVCLIGASSINSRRRAALAAAYAISESAQKEYKGKVVDVIGEKKEQEVREAIAKNKIDKDPVGNREVIITKSGNTLCYDCISGRYFKSDIERLKQAMNKLNRDMLVDMYISLNDFYYEIGLGHIAIGNDLGWNINNGLIDLYFSSHLAEDGTPCVVINYTLAPRYDYNRLLV